MNTSISITDKALQERIKESGGGNFSAGVGFITRFYYETMKSNSPEIDAIHVPFYVLSLSKVVTSMSMLHNLKLLVWKCFYDTSNLHTKFSNTADAVMEKANHYSTVECLALVESVRNYISTQKNGINNPKIELYFNIKKEE